MKKWNAPVVVELDVLQTKSGSDPAVKEKKGGAKPDHGNQPITS